MDLRGRGTRAIEIQDLFDLQLIGDPQVSPDGRHVAFVVTTTETDRNEYSSSIWLIEVDGDGAARPFTQASQKQVIRDHSPRWSPDGSKLCFISNRNGKTGLWLIPTYGGEARPIGPEMDAITGVNWSPDGRRLAFSAMKPKPTVAEDPDVFVTDRLIYKFNGRGFLDRDRWAHLWVLDVATEAVRSVTETPFDDKSPQWSQDGKSLFFTSDRHPEADMYFVEDLYRVDVETGTVKQLSDGSGPVTSPVLSSDGQIAFYGHNEGTDMTANIRLWRTDSEGFSWQCLTADIDRCVGNTVGTDVRFDSGVEGPQWFDSGEGLLFSLTDGGNCNLYVTDGDAHHVIQGLPPVISSFSVNAEGVPVIAAIAADWNNPGDLWIFRPGKAPEQRTDFNGSLLRDIHLSEPEQVSYLGADGWEIEGWLLKPYGYEAGEQYPLILEIHGGPAVTAGHVLMHHYQLLAAQGWGVMYNNPRGSKGYGERHARGVIGDWGGNDYRDLMAAVDHALTHPWVDPARLGVTGGSYGGYMTNWIVSQTDRFAAAVTFRSISNLYTKYGCADTGFFYNRMGMGGADLWDEEEFIMSRSPIRYAPQVKTPILIVHSEEDHRCPMEQAEQWYIALRRLGVPCEFVRYRGENHELSRSGKPRNRKDRLHRMLAWFQQYLASASEE